MPFGLRHSAPERMMNHILRDCQSHAKAYIDDTGLQQVLGGTSHLPTGSPYVPSTCRVYPEAP